MYDPYEKKPKQSEASEPRELPIPVFIGGLVAVVVVVVTFLIWLIGSSNVETRAGYIGYITKGAVFGKSTFYGLQVGPTSSGKTWMLQDPINISVTPTTLTEQFTGAASVLSKDQLKLDFQVHVLFRVDPSRVKDLVEKFSTLHEKGDVTENAFGQFIREPLRTAARQEVESYNAMEVGQHLTEISQKLTGWTEKYTQGSPFVIMSVVVGNLQYPKEVADAVSLKLKAQQDLQTKDTEVQIAKKDAEKKVAEARGIADAMAIVQQKLTPLYIQHEAIEAQKTQVNSPNHTVIYIPSGRNGVPLVSTIEKGSREEKVE